MVAGSFSDEITVALSADRLWKVTYSELNPVLLPKACAGLIDAVEIDGDGGPGTITTMKFSAGTLHVHNVGKQSNLTLDRFPLVEINKPRLQPWKTRRCSRAGWRPRTTRPKR
jgi:hypothetical protein